MKKIDILNFITDFRRSPNNKKTYSELVSHLGVTNEAVLNEMLTELQQTKVLKKTEVNGEQMFQVVHK